MTRLILLAAMLSPPGAARASWFESLVMPGDVTAKHAKIEHDCEKCHAPFDKSAQDSRCLNCHEDVADDLGSGGGYHGREPAVRGQICKECHSEHLGRGAQIVHLDRESFDHRPTDMPLAGAHAGVACARCHGEVRFRDAPSQCGDCHGLIDPHQASLGTVCANCHSEEAWSRVRFDHDETAFPLEGRHRDKQCAACHTSLKFKPTPTDCHSCHARDDRHRGSVGTQCQSCHTPRKWAETRFDHGRDARYALLGRHQRTPCEKCHEHGTARGVTPTNCSGCHERDDAHRGQFGKACETCHEPVDWKRPTFRHDRDTHFPLRGRHAGVSCLSCHRGNPREERLESRCIACHREDDVHHGREGARCETCHDEKGWRRDVLFDHEATRFPLLGAHARVACTHCHLSPSFKDVGRDCASCHEKDDVHHGDKGKDCERCHDVSTFKVIRPQG